MGKIIAMACAGLVVAGAATYGLFSTGMLCDSCHDAGSCPVAMSRCCGGPDVSTTTDAASSASLAVAGPVAAFPVTSPISTGVYPCCQAKAAPVQAAGCETPASENTAVNAAVGVALTAAK